MGDSTRSSRSASPETVDAEPRRDVHVLEPAEHEAIHRHSVDGVLLTVPGGRILAANPAACELLGRTASEICREGMSVLLDEDDAAVGQFLLQRAVNGRANGELAVQRGDGSRFTALVSSTIFATDDGELRAVLIIRDVSQQVSLRRQVEHQRDQIEHLTELDRLTGLPNRRGFEVAAERSLAFARRLRVPLRLVAFRVDDLKVINDRHGHHAGDLAIKRLATAITDTVRGVDVVARRSGAELVVLLFDVDAAGANRVVERVGEALAHLPDDGRPADYSATVADRRTDAASSVRELLECCDGPGHGSALRRRWEPIRIDAGRRPVVAPGPVASGADLQV